MKKDRDITYDLPEWLQMELIEINNEKFSTYKDLAIKKKIIRLGELFCGPGGLAFGASLAKIHNNNVEHVIQHEWASDYDYDSCETYIRNLCPNNPGSVIHHDVRTLDITKLSNIDAFAYGFPCNDFSIVGEQKGINGHFGPLIGTSNL